MNTRMYSAIWFFGRIAAFVLALSVLIVLQQFFPERIQALEHTLGDASWKLIQQQKQDSRLILVDIDEKSIQHLGDWPWGRDRLAQLSTRLNEWGTALQIYDIVLPTPSTEDSALLHALQTHQGVLAQAFALDPNNAHTTQGQLTGKLAAPDCRPNTPKAYGFIANAPLFSLLPAGHISPRVDHDGVVRQMPAVICFAGKAYPFLAISAMLHASQLPSELSVKTQTEHAFAANTWLESKHFPAVKIPVDDAWHIRIPYFYSADSFISVSAEDVLANRVNPELFDGAWVLIGSTALNLGDAVTTPQGGAISGLSVHANFISAMLDENIPFSPLAAQKIEWGVMILSMLFLFSMSARQTKNAWLLPIAGLILCAALFMLHTHLLTHYQLWLPNPHAIIFIACSALFLTLFTQIGTRFERDRLWLNLKSYLPLPVAHSQALKKPRDHIDAKRSQVTALYADLRNFSAFCEASAPEECANILHIFFSHAQNIVEAHGGTLENLHGDSVLAIWESKPSLASLHAAHELLLAMEAPLSTLNDSLEAPHFTPLGLSIGLEYGTAFVGSLGTAARRHHASLGTPVTVAVHLQRLTSELAQPILIGESLAAHLPPETLIAQGQFLLENLRRPYAVFAPKKHLH